MLNTTVKLPIFINSEMTYFYITMERSIFALHIKFYENRYCGITKENTRNSYITDKKPALP